MPKSKNNLAEWVGDLSEANIAQISIGELLSESAQKYPDSEALVYAHQPDIKEQRWTYAELDTVSTNLAKGFLDLGLSQGDAVGVWGPNHPEWIIIEYALAKAGLKLVTLNPLYKSKELIFALNTSQVVALVHAKTIPNIDVDEIVSEVKKDVPSLAHTLNFHEDLQNLIDEGEKKEFFLQPPKPSEVFMIQYTSGTTGVPKAAQMTHQGLITTSRNSHIRWNISHEQKVAHGFPLFHIGGSACMTLGACSLGATSLPLYIFKPSVTLDILEKEECSTFIGAPVLLTAMMEDPTFPQRSFPKLTTVVVGGSNPPIEFLKKCEQAFQVSMINGYGMTETCGLTSTALPNDPPSLKAIAGIAMPGVSLKIVGQENETLPCDETGELFYKGPGLMKGYSNLEDGTSGILEDGWFPTGDLATMNHDGYINIVGRAKEMIIRGGENLYPIEIENYLLEHPGVLEVAVIGLPDEKYDEECCAVIRNDSNQLTNENELKDWCESRISRWKIPRYIFFTDSFPVTPSGKIQKFKLQQKYVELISTKKGED
jgi:fatty-acyl-CoA synthase